MFRPLVTLLLAVILLSGCGEGADHLKTDEPARPFTATDLEGNIVNFPGDTMGKVVALRFWADWCPFCREEMTFMEQTYKDLGGQGFEILAVNVGQSRDTAAKFVDGIGVTYPALLDEKSETARLYGVIGLPTTFFFDRNGIMRGKILGEVDARVFARTVGDLM